MVRAIFCISPGRSGSHYLSGLFAEASNCESHHEAAPNGFGKPLQQFSRGDTAAMAEVAQQIAAAAKEANENGLVYCDTSHCFIKGFGWQIVDHFDHTDVGVVLLRRSKQAVIDSTFRARSVPLLNLGRRFILTPDKIAPIISPPRFFGLKAGKGFALAKFLQRLVGLYRRIRKKLGMRIDERILFPSYQRKAIAWYWEETYALGDKFMSDYPDCSYFETTVDDLNKPDVVRSMFEHFGLQAGEELFNKIGVPTNLKLEI